MDKELKISILRALANVSSKAEGSRLWPEILNGMKFDLEILADYFRTTREGALLIAIVHTLSYYEPKVTLKRILKYLDCSPARLLEFSDELQTLYQKGVFVAHDTLWDDQYMLSVQADAEFTVHRSISEAILKGSPMPEIKPNTPPEPNAMMLLEKIYRLVRLRKDLTISNGEALAYTLEIVTANEHMPLFERILKLGLNCTDTVTYLCLVWETASGKETIDVYEILRGIYDYPHERIAYAECLLDGSNQLLREGLIDIVEANFLNDIEVQLSAKSLDLLQESHIHIFARKKKKKSNIIYPDDITPRCLVYNEEEKQQLTLLKDLLHEEKLTHTQEQLLSCGLPKGITVLLHGAPGTGKTETVKQWACATNREIIRVDISKSKSMWFGESEKIIKRIFTDYKSYAQHCPRLPILLFNEADAILSKRKDINSSYVSQTENTMQNILLEELENFEGILVATTNLADNLDKAFERRFLFKVKFQKPGIPVKAEIWKIKLPQLDKAECTLLAEHFDFSGGQIDNIVRKHLVHEALHGTEAHGFDRILEYCRQETLGEERTCIGFKQSA
jgi:AAA+ superfamily predicted ATPase